MTRAAASLSALLAVWAFAASAAPVVRAEPARVVLGEDREVIVRVEAPRRLGPIAAAASAGSLSAAEETPSGWTYRWTPPDIRHPALAVLLFWQPSTKSAEAAVLALPLVGRTTLDLDTEPNASAVVRVGDESFGPVVANARGRVAVTIRVPPGVRTAVVTATARGRDTSRTVDLDVPEPSAWVAAVGPEPVPPEGGWLAVAAAGADAEGAIVRAEGAEVTRAEGGRDLATFRIEPKPAVERISLDVSLPGGGDRTLTVAVAENAWARRFGSTAPRPSRASLRALAGAFDSGAANMGPALEVSLSLPIPGAPALSAEASAGARAAWVSSADGAAAASAQLWAFPLSLGLRLGAFSRGSFALDLRVGAAIVPFRHDVAAPVDRSFAESGAGAEAFAALQGRYALGRIDALLELRGAFSTARTPRLEAHPGGALILAGIGWSP